MWTNLLFWYSVHCQWDMFLSFQNAHRKRWKWSVSWLPRHLTHDVKDWRSSEYNWSNSSPCWQQSSVESKPIESLLQLSFPHLRSPKVSKIEVVLDQHYQRSHYRSHSHPGQKKIILLNRSTIVFLSPLQYHKESFCCSKSLHLEMWSDVHKKEKENLADLFQCWKMCLQNMNKNIWDEICSTHTDPGNFSERVTFTFKSDYFSLSEGN